MPVEFQIFSPSSKFRIFRRAVSSNYVNDLSADMTLIVCLSRITKIHSKEMPVNTHTSCKITSRVMFNLQLQYQNAFFTKTITFM